MIRIVSNSTANENLPYLLFLSMFLLGGIFLLISAYRGRKGSIKSLNMIKEKKEFDEVIFESTISEVIKPIKNSNNTLPYLMFIKNKGNIIFQMMIKQNNFEQIIKYMKELSDNRNVVFVTKIDESINITHNVNLLLPDVI